jgi:hypothetical protein
LNPATDDATSPPASPPAVGAGRYLLVCAAAGAVLGWLPWLFHGPIPEKFDVLYIDGDIAVWGWYAARILIGFFVGATAWPSVWYLRGPLCGFAVMLPLTLVSLAMPGCGFPCMFWNLVTATLVGTAVGGVAWISTGAHHR